jgi:hypothetical protein
LSILISFDLLIDFLFYLSAGASDSEKEANMFEQEDPFSD